MPTETALSKLRWMGRCVEGAGHSGLGPRRGEMSPFRRAPGARGTAREGGYPTRESRFHQPREFFASPRRRRPRQRRRGEAEPPSGGRVDPVVADRSRRAWPCPASVERAGHGCAARRKRPPREGSRSREPRARRTRARLQGRMPVDRGGGSGSEAGDSADRLLARPGESGKGEGPARTFQKKGFSAGAVVPEKGNSHPGQGGPNRRTDPTGKRAPGGKPEGKLRGGEATDLKRPVSHPVARASSRPSCSSARPR